MLHAVFSESTATARLARPTPHQAAGAGAGREAAAGLEARAIQPPGSRCVSRLGARTAVALGGWLSTLLSSGDGRRRP